MSRSPLLVTAANAKQAAALLSLAAGRLEDDAHYDDRRLGGAPDGTFDRALADARALRHHVAQIHREAERAGAGTVAVSWECAELIHEQLAELDVEYERRVARLQRRVEDWMAPREELDGLLAAIDQHHRDVAGIAQDLASARY